MKKACLLFLLFICAALAVNAQDIITLTNGAQIQAKVLEINPGDIKYKDFNNQDGPVITVQKTGVTEIQYANGTKTVFNNASTPSVYSSSGSSGYKRDGSGAHTGFKKRSEKSEVHGWYFGLAPQLGLSNATSADPNYTASSSTYSGFDILATKMFNQHLGIQFGIGQETYNYAVNYYGNPIDPYNNDNFSLSCFTLPVRVLYFSNSKHKAGLYVSAGFDVSFVVQATDNEQDNLNNYYNTVLFTPYISSGIEFRNRNARGIWMFGPYYKTTVSNFYSGQANASVGNGGNTGTLNSIGLSIEYMGKFGRGW